MASGGREPPVLRITRGLTPPARQTINEGGRWAMAHDPIKHVQEHVQDTNPNHPVWPLFHDAFGGLEISLLKIPITDQYSFVLTKFMILELIAAALIIIIFVPIARRAATGGPPVGAWWNMFESLLTFIRDEVARPTL